MLNVTTNQLTGIDYKGGPHTSKRKRPTDADSAAPTKAPKTDATATPSMSTKTKAPSSTKTVHEKYTGNWQDSDTLS